MSSRREMDSSGREAGFTLIEVIVAGAVAVVLLVALLRAFASIWDLNSRVREDAESMIVARAVLETASTRSALSAKSEQGNAGNYGWGVTIAEAPLNIQEVSVPKIKLASPTRTAGEDEDEEEKRDEKAAAKFQLYRIQVVVRAPSGRRTSLETLRLAPQLR
jgi:type II secretory pathway pseudopilin PulG